MDAAHVQVVFTTKQQQFSVADNQFSVPASVTVNELSDLISGLLSTGENASSGKFDFLINGEFLRSSLEQHMKDRNISVEKVVEIEYVERQAAPEPEDSLQHEDWVSCLQGHGDFILSGCYDNTVKIWNTSGENLITVPAHAAPTKCVAWIKDEGKAAVKRFVSGSHDQTLLLWEWNQELNSVECAHICRGHAGSVDCVAIDPSQTKFCSGSWDKMLKIWSATPGTFEEAIDEEDKPTKKKKTDGAKVATKIPLMTLSGHSEAISSVLWSSSNEVCTASWDHTIRFWDLEKGAHVSTLNGTKVFFDVSYSSRTKTLISASADRHIRLWDARISDGAIVTCSFSTHTGWVSGVDWSPVNDYHFISGSYDKKVILWDTRSNKAPLFVMSGHEDKVLAVDWSLKDYILSGAADNTLKIFKHTDCLTERTVT